MGKKTLDKSKLVGSYNKEVLETCEIQFFLVSHPSSFHDLAKSQWHFNS
jgi:hypothetical protein